LTVRFTDPSRAHQIVAKAFAKIVALHFVCAARFADLAAREVFLSNALVLEACNLVVPAPVVIVVGIRVGGSGSSDGVIVLFNEFTGAAFFTDLATANIVLVDGKGGGKEGA
jgi:hypothetical protein